MLYTLSPPHAGHRKDFVVQEGGRVVRTGVTNQTFFILVFFSCFRVKQTKKIEYMGKREKILSVYNPDLLERTHKVRKEKKKDVLPTSRIYVCEF